MTTADRILELTSARFRRRPLLRRFREGVRVQQELGGYELRVDFGGLGFDYHGGLRLPSRWGEELCAAHNERFLYELEEGFVKEYDRHLAKSEGA